MEKRGASHIEMILAFVLFTGFVIFAFIFFNPVGSDRLVDTTTDYTFTEIIDVGSVQLETFSVKIDTESQDIKDPIAVDLESIDLEKNVRVENQDGGSLPSKKIGDIVHFDWDTDFAMIKISEDINPSTSDFNTNPLNPDLYEIASSDSRKVLSEKKMEELKTRYQSNYNNLKEEFNLPGRAQFGFSLTNSDGFDITPETSIPEGLDVFSDSRRHEVLKENGELIFADLIVKIW